ncbi:MAG: hypothetical protein AB7E73_17320 [Burkholderiales bacterium]
MRAFFTTYAADDALLLRGAEGEAAAHPRRKPVIEWLDGKTAEVWRGTAEEHLDLPEVRNAEITAKWINEVLAEKRAAPAAIAHQVKAGFRIKHEIGSNISAR